MCINKFQWINVEKELPEVRIHVIVIDASESYWIAFLEKENDATYFVSSTDYEVVEDVVAWSYFEKFNK